MALGVNHREVKRMFVRHGLVLAGIGIAVGVGVAAGVTRLMASLLFHVSPLDGATYVAVSLRPGNCGRAGQLSAGSTGRRARPGAGASRRMSVIRQLVTNQFA